MTRPKLDWIVDVDMFVVTVAKRLTRGGLHLRYMGLTLPTRRPNSDRKWSGWRRLLGIGCILLVVFGASAELNHAHASGRIHPDCSLCVSAHSAARVTVHTVAAVALRPVADCADPEPIYFRRSLDIRLSIRPPPVAPVFA